MPSRRTLLRTNPIVQLIGLIVVSIVAVAGSYDSYRATTVVPVTAAELATDPPIGRLIHVTCTNAPSPPARDADPDAVYVTTCAFDRLQLLVVADRPVHESELTGKLQPMTGDEPFAHAITSSHAYDRGYLDLTTGSEDHVVRAMVTVLGLGAIAGWWLFFRRRRRLAA
jgi:hypothetical protein